jgi:formamidopyrimidine-DNA glycosylase
MPELPEVETSRRGITPHILGQTITGVVIRDHRLRWPIPKQLATKATSQRIERINRRGKYLLLETGTGCIIIHLGMSGSLRICAPDTPPEKHDHVDFVFGNGKALRLRDPRRFGAVLWTSNDPFKHKLLIQLGPEPLGDEFNADHLHLQTRKRSASIKSVIMNSHIVVGVGNIYACEALFIAGINPKRKAGTLSKARCEKLVSAIRQILNAAIEQGGTTLRDFVREDGQPGYFKQHLYVYGRTDQPCLSCGTNIRQFTQQQRSTFYCARCQK